MSGPRCPKCGDALPINWDPIRDPHVCRTEPAAEDNDAAPVAAPDVVYVYGAGPEPRAVEVDASWHGDPIGRAALSLLREGGAGVDAIPDSLRAEGPPAAYPDDSIESRLEGIRHYYEQRAVPEYARGVLAELVEQGPKNLDACFTGPRRTAAYWLKLQGLAIVSGNGLIEATVTGATRHMQWERERVPPAAERIMLEHAVTVAKRIAAEYLAKGNEIGWKLNASGAIAVADALETARRDLPETKEETDEREARAELEALGESILAEAEATEAAAKAAGALEVGSPRELEFVRAAMDYLRARGGL